MHVRATVVSRPTADRAIVDRGSKVLTSDQYYVEHYGRVVEYPEAFVPALSEEHGIVDLSRAKDAPEGRRGGQHHPQPLLLGQQHERRGLRRSQRRGRGRLAGRGARQGQVNGADLFDLTGKVGARHRRAHRTGAGDGRGARRRRRRHRRARIVRHARYRADVSTRPGGASCRSLVDLGRRTELRCRRSSASSASWAASISSSTMPASSAGPISSTPATTTGTPSWPSICAAPSP